MRLDELSPRSRLSLLSTNRIMTDPIATGIGRWDAAR